MHCPKHFKLEMGWINWQEESFDLNENRWCTERSLHISSVQQDKPLLWAETFKNNLTVLKDILWLLTCVFWILGEPSVAIRSPTVQFSSVTQSCPTLCDPMDCSMPGLPVHHQITEFTQTHIHWVGDAIQPSISSSVVPFSSCLQSFPASEDPQQMINVNQSFLQATCLSGIFFTNKIFTLFFQFNPRSVCCFLINAERVRWKEGQPIKVKGSLQNGWWGNRWGCLLSPPRHGKGQAVTAKSNRFWKKKRKEKKNKVKISEWK